MLHRCEELSEATGGWFDARINGVTDPSGYVKGWALERLSRALVQAGAGDHRITAGYDVRVRGSAAPGRRWRVPVRDPRTGEVRRMVRAHDLGIATSGGSRVVDPHTGEVRDALGGRSRSSAPTWGSPTRTPPPCTPWAPCGPAATRPSWPGRVRTRR
ncbi:hypothetical protein GCM10020001_026950 [Nonomuraea salmonea]